MLRLICKAMFLVLIGTGVGAQESAQVVGQTYDIEERDALSEIEQRARDVDWGKIWAEGREKTKNYRPESVASLPAAIKNRTFKVDMSKRLEIDVPDGKGGILYPRGTVVNPLSIVSYSRVLVVLDASDADQVAWFRSSAYADSPNVKLLITGGGFYKTAEKLGRQVYYAPEVIAERFQLRAVPSVIKQAGDLMQVDEIAVPRNRRSK